MRVQINNLQLAFILANFSLSASVIHLPRVVVDAASQNAWLVYFLLIPFIALLVMVGMHGINTLPHWDVFSLEKNKPDWGTKGFSLVFGLFLTLVLVKDLRSFTSVIQSSLLPTTPLEITTIIIMGASLYLVWSGLEVIARFTEFYLPAFVVITLASPFILADKIKWANIEPIFNMKTIPSLFQATFNALPWAGEVVILFLLLGHVKSLKNVKFTVFFGTLFGLFQLFIIIFLIISVFGADLVRHQYLPAIGMIREMTITDFLDRVDLFLVVVWIPLMFAKLSLILYGVHRSLNKLFGKNSKINIIPLVITGVMSIWIFKNNISHFQFFMTYIWAVAGLGLEVLIVLGFIILVRIEKGNRAKLSKRIE
ncbi:GerAB/ArcD/ProY family transporter [Paenibacillus tyrfis]|uniref:GerAB/ArcD/ProY family transporter n=1 Tax=Paenibacillus tyrfis TaxID=1501230 RepID=UPI00209DFABB|nr:endospore germination permease [Paenibacillus tyrfis]MCP1311604.1 endospore germination permease [Paenibacillus tyrfis]